MEQESVAEIESNKSNDSGVPAEQTAYWNKDLKYKRWSLVISGVGFFFVAAGIVASYWQISRAQKTMCASAQTSVVVLVTNLDRVFIDRPNLRPYFYGRTPIDASHTDFPQAYATAEMLLDIFDLVAGQSRDYAECWSATDAWDAWIMDMLSTSPILRDTYDQRKNWYGPELEMLRNQVKVPPPAVVSTP